MMPESKRSSGLGGVGDTGGMESMILNVETGVLRTIVDLSEEAREFCEGRGDGLLTVFVPHATAGLAVMETGAGSEEDLFKILDGVMPRDIIYRHRHGAEGHGADHVLPAFVSPSVVIPVFNGRLTLGAWQSIVLVDTNTDNPDRKVHLTFLPG